MITENGNIVDHVLVVDVAQDAGLFYYCGYFKNGVPVNSTEYTDAVKIPYKEEAQRLCDKMNEFNSHFKYHVEDHMYMSEPKV